MGSQGPPRRELLLSRKGRVFTKCLSIQTNADFQYCTLRFLTGSEKLSAMAIEASFLPFIQFESNRTNWYTTARRIHLHAGIIS